MTRPNTARLRPAQTPATVDAALHVSQNTPPPTTRGGVFVDRKQVAMVSIAIILLIIGVVIVVVAAVTPIPPPIGTLGWVALAFGVILLVLGLLLPALPVHYGATHVVATQA